MILYLVRHGQTDFNKDHRLQGLLIDEPLNEKGIEETKAMLESLPKDFEVIFSSPLKRVLASAQIISDFSGKPILIREEIRERDFGSLAGKTWDEIPDGRKIQATDRELEYDYRPYGGESAEDVKKRLSVFLDELKKSSYSKVLAVSSIGIIRMAYYSLKNEKVVDVKNVSIHTFEL
jgi:broad specificity phosphatase PhoE